jgi:hypothetical protein
MDAKHGSVHEEVIGSVNPVSVSHAWQSFAVYFFRCRLASRGALSVSAHSSAYRLPAFTKNATGPYFQGISAIVVLAIVLLLEVSLSIFNNGM